MSINESENRIGHCKLCTKKHDIKHIIYTK
jgi:hypothetical protein